MLNKRLLIEMNNVKSTVFLTAFFLFILGTNVLAQNNRNLNNNIISLKNHDKELYKNGLEKPC